MVGVELMLYFIMAVLLQYQVLVTKTDKIICTEKKKKSLLYFGFKPKWVWPIFIVNDN